MPIEVWYQQGAKKDHLDQQEDIYEQSYPAVGGSEMRSVVQILIDENNSNSSGEEDKCSAI